MTKVDIQLTYAENVKRFVNIVNKYNFDLDLRSGRHVVDAKSILGIFSLDLSHPVSLEISGEENAPAGQLEALLKDIEPFTV